MKGEGLSNIFLEKFLFPKCANFIGVYSVDTIPPNLWKKNCCCIINLSEAHLPGSHFIAVYIDHRNDLWYMDSFGLPPPAHNYHLMNFLKKWEKKERLKMSSPLPFKILIHYFVGGMQLLFVYLLMPT